MYSILFVCTANICRSPMASGLFKHKIASLPDADQWKIDSAGTWASEGSPASARSQSLLKDRGIDLEGHLSKSVTSKLLSSFNLILTMERGHKEALQAEFPDLKKRIFLMSEMIDQRFEIRDPYNGTLDDYKQTMQEINHILELGFEKIRTLAQDPVAEPGS